MSQWGEIEDINLVREKTNNKSKGFAFAKYEDQRSTILAVDNFNNTQLLDRLIRCDHVDKYKLPKDIKDKEIEALEENPNVSLKIKAGHAYKFKDLASEHNIEKGVDLWKPLEDLKVKKQRSENDNDSNSKINKKKESKKRMVLVKSIVVI
jgi:RNA-binding motif X-linked protein 2